MRPFEWSEEFDVHVSEIDVEHRELFRLADDLYGALIAEAPAGEVQAALAELGTHVAEHFSHEEGLMRASGYLHYAWHRRQHAAARARMATLERRIRGGDRNAALLALDLSVALKNHIRLADRMLGAYLRNQQRARAALAS